MRALRFGATGSLLLLFAINMANYIDRYLLVGLKGPIQDEFHLSNQELGWINTAFVFVYTIASPLCGYLADRIARRYVVSGAVSLWSLATAFASRAWSFPVLIGSRAAVGIGESGYNAAGQALLADLYPSEKRNRVLAFFNLALPVGAALGFWLAGTLNPILGWRNACLTVGLPGLALGTLALLLPGRNPGETAGSDHGEPEKESTLEAFLTLIRDPVYVTNALSFGMQSFALGALAFWAPDFLRHVHGQSEEGAQILTGKIAAGAGFVGTALGAVIADRLSRGAMVRGYALVTGVGYLLSAPLLVAALFLPSYDASIWCMFLAMVGAFLGTGPQNAIVSDRAPVAFRASAFALVVVILHLMGDAPSPPVVGWAYDRFQAQALGKGPAIQRALLLAVVALTLAAVSMGACAIFARAPRKSAEGAP
ncbi:MFS transporter [bacterium]|nr:MFS transporter [bacterium]